MRLKNIILIREFLEMPTYKARRLVGPNLRKRAQEFITFLEGADRSFDSLEEAVKVFEATIDYRGQRVQIPFSYRQFFEAMAELWGIDLNNASQEQKDDFFTFIELAWRGENPKTDDRDRGGDDRDLPSKPPFTLEQLANKVLELWGVSKSQFAKLPAEKQKDIITTVKTFWQWDKQLDDEKVRKLLSERTEAKQRLLRIIEALEQALEEI